MKSIAVLSLLSPLVAAASNQCSSSAVSKISAVEDSPKVWCAVFLAKTNTQTPIKGLGLPAISAACTCILEAIPTKTVTSTTTSTTTTRVTTKVTAKITTTTTTTTTATKLSISTSTVTKTAVSSITVQSCPTTTTVAVPPSTNSTTTSSGVNNSSSGLTTTATFTAGTNSSSTATSSHINNSSSGLMTTATFTPGTNSSSTSSTMSSTSPTATCNPNSYYIQVNGIGDPVVDGTYVKATVSSGNSADFNGAYAGNHPAYPNAQPVVFIYNETSGVMWRNDGVTALDVGIIASNNGRTMVNTPDAATNALYYCNAPAGQPLDCEVTMPSQDAPLPLSLVAGGYENQYWLETLTQPDGGQIQNANFYLVSAC